MRISRTFICVLLAASVAITFVGLGCAPSSVPAASSRTSQSSPTAPTPQPAPLPNLPGGRWEGTSTVESLENDVPQCVAPFWRRGFTDSLSVDARPFLDSVDMLIHQQASDGCHLRVGFHENSIEAGTWPYDEFDCALVPSVCGVGCHFRLSTSDWNCSAAPPEVWITDAGLHGTIDPVTNRIQGILLMEYDHSLSSRAPWKKLRVTARIDLRKTN